MKMSEKFQLQQLQEYLLDLFAESLFAVYLYGSAVDGRLGPESDLASGCGYSASNARSATAACTSLINAFTSDW